MTGREGLIVKGIVAEINGKYAVILTQDGLFKRVRALPGMTVGMEIEAGQKAGAAVKRRFTARVASMAAVGLFVLGIGFGAYSYTVPYSYVDIDINPSIELAVNVYDRIIGAEALNEDGEKLLEDKDLRHKKLDIGVSELLSRAVEQGYLEADSGIADGTDTQPDEAQLAESISNDSGKGDNGQYPNDGIQPGQDSSQTSGSNDKDAGNTPPKQAAPANDKTVKEPVVKNAVMVTVSSNNTRKSEELKKKIASTASKELNKDKVSSEILVGQASNAQREAAKKLGVTPGKLTLIEDVIRHLPEKDIEDVKNTAVKDLIEITRNNAKAGPKDKDEPGRKDSGKTEKADKNSNKDSGMKESPQDSRNNANNSIKDGKNPNAAPADKNGKDARAGSQPAKDNKGRDSQNVPGNKNSGAQTAPANKNGGDQAPHGNKGSDKKDSGKNSSNDRKEEKNDKNKGPDVKEALEKAGEELKKEREKLREELLGQIGNGPGINSKVSAGKDAQKQKDDGRVTNNKKDDKAKKDDKGKDQNNKKSGPGSNSKGKAGPGR